MEFEIKMNFENHNDISGRCYKIMMPVQQVKLTDDGYVSQDEKEKYINEIVKQIPDTQKILSKDAWIYRGSDSVSFEVFTKSKRLIEKEKRIRKILKNNGFNICDYHTIDIDEEEEDLLELDIPMRYTEKEIMKIKKLLKARRWQVIFDSHMENMYMVYRLGFEELPECCL